MTLASLRALCDVVYGPLKRYPYFFMDHPGVNAVIDAFPLLLAVAEAAHRLADNIAEFDAITDNCFLERLDAALAALEAAP